MPRFSDPRRLTGETADRPDLLDLGKKLLGYLSEQRKFSGVTTCSIERRTADGSIVRARFVGNLPCIEILPQRQVVSSQPAVLGGFIVRPSPASDQWDNPAKNHVVLFPKSRKGEQWSACFYDGSSGAVRNTYGRTFPAGLGGYGTVDWRNHDQSVMVAFHGPTTRYFRADDHGQFQSFVYYKGNLLLDVATLRASLLGNAIDPVVRGACLRSVKDVGLCLLLCLVDRLDTSLPEYLVRVPARPDSTVQPWTLAPTLTARPAEAAILATQTSAFTVDFTDHPWMFNQSGTEARCIRFTTTQVLECILTQDEFGAWSYSQAATPRPVVTSNASVTTTVNADFRTFSTIQYDQVFWDSDGTVDSNVTVSPQTIDNPVDAAALPVTGIDSSSEVVADTPYILAAVDFRDDVPVYASIPVATSTTTVSETRTISGDNTSITTANSIVLHDNAIDFTIGYDFTIDSTGHCEYTETYEGFGGTGIHTDWADVSAHSTRSISLVADGDETSAYHWERDIFNMGLDPAQNNIQPPGYDPDTLDFHDESASGSVTVSSHYVAEFVTQTIAIGTLDLRYKLLVYAVVSAYTAFDSARSDTTTFTDRASFNGDGGDWLVPAYSLSTSGLNTPVRTVGAVAGVPMFDVNDDWGDRGLSAPTTVDAQRNATSAPYGRALTVTQPASVATDFISRTDFIDSHPDAVGQTAYAALVESTSSGDYTPSQLVVSIGSMMRNSALGQDVTFFDFAGDPGAIPAGSWQVYQNFYCYSMARFNTPSALWNSGLGEAVTGLTSDQTLTELTAATDDEVRFHPVSILTPTALR